MFPKGRSMLASLADGSVSPCSESRCRSSRNAWFVFAIATRYGMRNAFRGVAWRANVSLTGIVWIEPSGFANQIVFSEWLPMYSKKCTKEKELEKKIKKKKQILLILKFMQHVLFIFRKKLNLFLNYEYLYKFKFLWIQLQIWN